MFLLPMTAQLCSSRTTTHKWQQAARSDGLEWLGCSAQRNGCPGPAERATASQQENQPASRRNQQDDSTQMATGLPVSPAPRNADANADSPNGNW